MKGRAAMGQYVGLDVSMKETAVCVLDEAGWVVWRGRSGLFWRAGRCHLGTGMVFGL